MTEIEAWKFIADMIPGNLHHLQSVCYLRYCIKGQWFQDFGLCNIIYTMQRCSLISQKTRDAMSDRLKEKNNNFLVFGYLWDPDWSGWNQRKEFCLEQVRKLTELSIQLGCSEGMGYRDVSSIRDGCQELRHE